MPLAHVYTLMCDDVRVENNGKYIIIGLYTPNILLPILPIGLPGLSFVTAYSSDRPVRYQFRANIKHLETGHLLGELMGVMTHAAPGLGIGIIKFANIIFNHAGKYNLITKIEDHTEPFIYDFDVIQLQQGFPPQQGFLPPQIPR